jgi:hypothetical protein
MLTNKEKEAAWHRLRNGLSVQPEAMLVHVVSNGSKTAESLSKIDESLGNKARACYRMVKRGIITNHSTFNRVSKQMMES